MGKARRLALLVALLVALAIPATWGYPRTAEPAFGVRRLREFETSNNGRRMTMDLVHDDADVAGRRFEIKYDVELAPHIRPHNTDDEEHLISVFGSADGTMQVVFDSAAAAAAFASGLDDGDLIHGHYQDEEGEEATVFPYHARVLASKLDQETLSLDIDVPTLTEVFINAKASILVALAPEDYYVVPHDGEPQAEAVQQDVAAPTNPSARRRHLDVTGRRLGAFDWLNEWTRKNLQHIAKLGDMVLGVVDTVVKLASFALTGNLFDKMDQAIDLFDFNYDKATRGPICGFNLEDNLLPAEAASQPPFWGECRQCYAYSNVSMRFEVDIFDYKVNKLVAMVEGALDFNFFMDQLSVASAGFIGGYKRILKSIKSKPFTITLGNIAVDISSETPVKLGVDMWMNGPATFSVDLSARADIKAGYRFISTAEPQQQMVNKVDYDFGGKGVRLLRWARREVGMRLYLLPVVQLNLALGTGALKGLAHIGGPNFGMEASVTATVTSSNDTSAQVARTCGVEGTIGANITLKIGSDTSQDLLRGKGVVKPKGIYSKEFPIGTDYVRFRPFTMPTLPRQLYPWNDDGLYVDDDLTDDALAASLAASEAMNEATPTSNADTIEEIPFDSPDPPPPPVWPPPLAYEWGKIGTVFQGTLQQLKDPSVVDCGSGFVPPFMDVNAVVVGSTLVGSGGFLDCAITFSYGKTEPTTTTGSGIGAFAAIDQTVWRFSFYNYELESSCSSIKTNAMAANWERYYPDIIYRANTTTEPIALPSLAGRICENGNKIKLYDTENCFIILLDRNSQDTAHAATTTTTTTTRRALDALSNEERRHKLGHMDRFGRILQQCAPPKPPSPAPTTSATPPPSRSPTRAPSVAPSRAPSVAPSVSPSRAPSTAPSTAPTQVTKKYFGHRNLS